MTLSPAQTQRFQKVFREPFYLLDHTDGGDQANIIQTFKISGSTRSVYTVHLYANGTLCCDCMDMRTNCHKLTCVCKHVCFVLVRVLKYIHTGFYHTRRLQPVEIERLAQRCRALSTFVDPDVQNHDLTERYRAHQPIHFEPTKAVSAEDECPICYLPLDDPNPIVGCPQCKNNLHETCMIRWLSQSSRATCVYCRSTVWEHYGRPQQPYIQL